MQVLVAVAYILLTTTAIVLTVVLVSTLTNYFL